MFILYYILYIYIYIYIYIYYVGLKLGNWCVFNSNKEFSVS